MTEAECDAYIALLERLADLDSRGKTRIGRLYSPKRPPSDYERDITSATLNNELYGDNN
jgi:hypothetical protein